MNEESVRYGLTAEQLMELPCLRRVRVLAGRMGLSRIVAAISVLENAAPAVMQKKSFILPYFPAKIPLPAVLSAQICPAASAESPNRG